MIDRTRQTLGSGSLDLQIYNLIAQNEGGPDLAYWWAAVGIQPAPGCSRGYSVTPGPRSLIFGQIQYIIHESSKLSGAGVGRCVACRNHLPAGSPWNLLSLIMDRSWLIVPHGISSLPRLKYLDPKPSVLSIGALTGDGALDTELQFPVTQNVALGSKVQWDRSMR